MPMSEIRINISQANRSQFGGMTHNPLAWPRIFAQILASSSGVWGRNKPEPTVLSVVRVERVRDDQRLLFRFVDVRTRKDLRLANMVIEHGQTVRPMTMASVPMLVTAREIFEVHGETKYHQAFSVNGLRGVMPQARTLVLRLDVPGGRVDKLIIGSTFGSDDDEAGERGTVSNTMRQRTDDANMRRTPFPQQQSHLEGRSRVFRG